MPRFVIQEHYARSHHFDLRLERDGVLVSWAVPKGMPTDTKKNRLAMRVEDHDLSHLEVVDETPVEGVPGAVAKSIWDRGTCDVRAVRRRDGDRRPARGAARRQVLRSSAAGKNWLVHLMKEEPEIRGIESIASAPQERAEDRAATTRRLLGELRPYGGKLLLVLALVVLGAAAQAGGPWLIGRAIDRYILPGDVAGLSRIMLLLFGVYVVGAVASRGQVYQVGSIGQSLLASMRARIFDRLQHLPLRYFDRRPVGDLMSRVTNDVDTLNQLFSQGLTQLLGSLFSLIGIVVAMLFLNWNLALACFTIIPIMLLLTSFFARRARRAFRLTRETVGDVTAGAQEDITGCARRRRSTGPRRTSPASGGATRPTATPTCRRWRSPRRSPRP